jgi:hypothetical protein
VTETETETEARQSELARAVLGQPGFVYACISGSSDGGQADRRTGRRRSSVGADARWACSRLCCVLPLSTDWRDVI